MLSMSEFIDMVWQAAFRGELVLMGNDPTGRRWTEPPSAGRVLALSPHPDDPEAVAVTLRTFAEAGCRVRCAITGRAHGGVTDAYARRTALELERKPRDRKKFKAGIRRAEQERAAWMAGFVDGEVRFVTDAEEDDSGDMRDTPANARLLAAELRREDPDIAIMPWGEDTNPGHVALFNLFRRAATELALQRGRPLLAMYNRDPKTTEIEEQLAVPFDGEAARWKAELLRCHDSQQQRNLSSRGYGMDERILRMNRRIQQELSARRLEGWKDESPYAESFHLELFG